MTQNDTPLISVIMPVYNASLYLKDSIESILNQTYGNFELLILNDGSSDNSSNIIKEYEEKDKRVVLINSDINKGLIAQLNHGLKIAKGEYIARMDADDISLPQRFSLQLKFIQKHQYDIIGSNIKYFSNRKNIIKKRSRQASDYPDLLAQLFFSSALFHPTVFFHRRLLIHEGFLYKQDFYAAEDYELWTRILPTCKAGNINEVLLLYRSSQTQVSNSKGDIQQINTTNAKANYIRSMCGFLPTPAEVDVLNSYFYRSSDKKLSVSDMSILFELFKKIINGLNDITIKRYYCRRLCVSICMHSSRNNLYYTEYKKRDFKNYYNPGILLQAKALVRQFVK